MELLHYFVTKIPGPGQGGLTHAPKNPFRPYTEYDNVRADLTVSFSYGLFALFLG